MTRDTGLLLGSGVCSELSEHKINRHPEHNLTKQINNMLHFPDKIELRKESNAKKKRKSRTAFTNTQIFELEKRFIYQKYLSPADRDEISCKLGISGGQVRYLSDIQDIHHDMI